MEETPKPWYRRFYERDLWEDPGCVGKDVAEYGVRMKTAGVIQHVGTKS